MLQLLSLIYYILETHIILVVSMLGWEGNM